MADTLTVRNQDELDRVLNNLNTLDEDREIVLSPRDPDALRRTNFVITKAVPNPIRVGKGAHAHASVPGVKAVVEGGKFESPNAPQRLVWVEDGNATLPRGSVVHASGGTVHIHGGNVKDDSTEITLRGKAQASTDSGKVFAYDQSYASAGGTADVRASGKARVDTFGKATFRADDDVTVRAHESSSGHAHGRSEVYTNDKGTEVTWVSPEARVHPGFHTTLKVSDDVPTDLVSAAVRNDQTVTVQRITPFDANFKDALAVVSQAGARAFDSDLPAAPASNGDVQRLLEGLPVGDPRSTQIMEAFNSSYRHEADKAADAVLSSTPEVTTKFMEGAELASKNMWDNLPESEQPTYAQVAEKYGKRFADGYVTKRNQLEGVSPTPLKPYTVTSDLGDRTWQADSEEHAREQHEDAFPEEPIIGVSPPNPSNDSDAFIVYEGADGEPVYQHWKDVVSQGGLVYGEDDIDPDDEDGPYEGDDMPVIGWSESDGGAVRTDDMELVYRDAEGSEHRQAWQNISEVGTLIDSETGNDMELDGWAQSDTDNESGCCAGCECGNGCLPDCKIGPTCPGHDENAGDDGFADSCAQCGGPFETTSSGVTYHVTEDGETDYDLDGDHVPYSSEGVESFLKDYDPSLDDKADAMYQEYLADKAEVSETGTLTYRELIADAEKHSEPFIDDETPDGHFGVTVKNISGISTYWLKGPKGDLDAVVVGRNQDGNNYRGGGVLGGEYINRGVSPRYPITEKAAVIPNHDISDDDQKTIELDAVEGVRPEGTVIAMPDDILLEVGYKDGNPNTLRTFDWEKKKWNRSMSTAAGPGKALLGELESLTPAARKVPESTAAAYGHCTKSCAMCGRGLKSAASLSAGYGPECKGKLR